MRRPWVLAATLMVLVGPTVGCAGTPANRVGFVSGDGAVTVLAPDQRPTAPIIEGTTLTGGSWRSSEAAGKVLVYNVWGSWCGPCREEAPDLVAASRRTQDRAVFVGLNTRDPDPAAPLAFSRRFEVDYPSLFDPGGALLLEFSRQLPANAIPTTLLIDPQGRVAARVVGVVRESTLVGLIDDLTAGR